MRLRYAGRCCECGSAISAGSVARYDRATKSVTCLECDTTELVTQPAVDGLMTTSAGDEREHGEPTPEYAPATGVAGASARTEYERRKTKRAARIREAHPRIGGLLLALTDDPQTTKAWATGARGEELLGERLDRLTEHGVLVLHDRRIPGTRANIDHIVVARSGVFVIDAKRYQGRPRLHVQGGLLRPRTEKLMVGSRDCTKFAGGVHKQLSLVKSALDGTAPDVPVRGFLCFVQAEWPLFGGDVTIDGVDVLSPKKAADQLLRGGDLDTPAIQALHRRLAEAFPAAV